MRETVESRHLQCGELGGSLVFFFPPFFNYYFFFFFLVMSDYFLVRLCIGVKGVTLFNKCRDKWTRRMIRIDLWASGWLYCQTDGRMNRMD